MNTAWQTSPDAPSAAEECAHHVISVLDDALSREEFATFAVSGGTTPRLLFESLAKRRFHWRRIHFFWVDERCVPPTDPASNYKLVQDCLLGPANVPPENVHRIVGEIAPADAAARYTQDLRHFFELGATEFPRFDLVHRGMGPDAHTASLFPGEPLIDDHEHLAAAVFVPKFNQWRVTLLPAVLTAAKHTVLLVAGADKAEPVRATFHEPIDPRRYPAQIAARDGRTARWFLDEKAAALLR